MMRWDLVNMWVNLNKNLLGNNHDSILWGWSTHRTNTPGNNCPPGSKNVECKKDVIKIFYISYTGRYNV